MTYDDFRRVSQTRGRRNQTIDLAYDGFGRVEEKYANDPNEVAFTVEYEYDLLGRLDKTRKTVVSQTDTTKNTYDKAGRLIRVEYPDSMTVSYQYDAAGNRTRLTYPDASYITYDYDQLNRMTAVKNAAGTALASYTYDSRSRRTDLDYLNGAYADYSYDPASRLLYVDNRGNNGQHKYAYTYDKVGNRKDMTVTDSGGTRIHVYTYDSIYQVTGVDYPPELSYLATDTEFNYDAAGNRTSVIDGSGTCTYTANNLNQYTAADTTSYQYDASGNMTADGTYSYFYDPENRLIRVTKSGSPPSPPTPLAQALDLPLVYTTSGSGSWQVTGEGSYTGGSCAIGYSAYGGAPACLQTQVEGGGQFTFWWKSYAQEGDSDNTLEFRIGGVVQNTLYGTNDEWQQKSYTLGSGPHTLQWVYTRGSQDYDGSGYVDGLTWDGAMPVLPEPDPNNWTTLLYRYDAAGRRIEKQYNDETITKYVYDGDHCIAEYDGSNNLRRKYIYGPCTDEPISMIEAAGTYAGTYYYHFDALGSVVALTNSSGNTVEVYEYDVYGRVGATDAGHPNRFLFTGREFDKETGLYYYRARYYNPQIGRFLQMDPKGYGDGMNPYRYCANNPLSGTDPSGTFVLVPPFVPVPRVDEWVKERWHNLMKRAADLGRPDYPGDWNSTLYFWRWYFWGGEAITTEIDLGAVGLLGKFKQRLGMDIWLFEYEVEQEAKAFAREMLLKGKYVDSKTTPGSIPYDFAPGVTGLIIGIITDDPLVVLGNGSIATTTTIRAERVSANTAKWSATIEYDVRDWFRDPLNSLTNTRGNAELAGGKPYPITAHWEKSMSGTVTVGG